MLEQIILQIKNARDINNNSVKIYLGKINMLHQKIFKSRAQNIQFLKDVPTVMTHVNEMNMSSKRVCLSAILVFISPIKKTPTPEWRDIYNTYNQHLRDAMEEYKLYLQGQKMTIRQRQNWTTMKALHSVRNSYYYYIKKLGYIGKHKTVNDLKKPKKHLDLLQKWVVSSLYTLAPPRRSLDYRTMKVISLKKFNRLPKEVKDYHNYLVIQSRNRKMFNFGEYKTRSTYGCQQFPVGKELNTVLNLWRRYNTSEYLLLKDGNKPFDGSSYNKYLHSVFESTGKRVSSSLIRNIYLTEMFHGESTIFFKEKIATAMGHSINTQQSIYRKRKEQES